MTEQPHQKNYESLEPRDKTRFNSIYYQQLVKSLDSSKNTSIQDFYDEVWGKFYQKEETRQSKEESSNENHSKTSNENNKLEPFQLYIKQQRKLRKDEFHNQSNSKVQTLLSHEWFKLSPLEKQKIVENNGRFHH